MAVLPFIGNWYIVARRFPSAVGVDVCCPELHEACGCVQQPRRQQQLYERRCKSRVSTARTTTAHSQGSSRRGCSTHTIISQNCRGLKSHTRIAELVDVLRRREAFAACVQETWRAGDEQLLEGDACFIGVGPPAQQGRGSQGVGLVLSRLAVAAWREAGSDIWQIGRAHV